MVGRGGSVLIFHRGADGHELVLGKVVAEDELFPIGRQQGLVFLGLIDGFQGRRIVDGGDVVQVAQLHAVHEGQGDQRHGGHDGTHHNEGGAAAALAPVAVRDGAEEGQHEQGQDIVRRHDHAGPGLGHAKLVGQDHGDGVVVSLPECTDQEKGKAYKDRPFVAEFHSLSSKVR